MSDDPTLIRNQPALTTSSGRVWLIVGGLFSAVAIGVLLSLAQLPPTGLGLWASAVVAVIYVAMIVARVTITPGRRRLTLLAAGLLAIAGTSLTAVTIIAFTASPGSGQ